MFALYLDIQKNILIEDLAEDEIKGRWKSFIGKWNRGELAEGWYDPATFEKAKTSAVEHATQSTKPIRRPERRAVQSDKERSMAAHDADLTSEQSDDDDDDDDDGYGPALDQDAVASGPNNAPVERHSRPGPAIPSLQDLQYKRELAATDASESRREHMQSLRSTRLVDRAQQAEILDAIAPRAEPGTRERQLEKRREAAASNRAFASAKEASGDVDLRDADVMGEDETLDDLKRLKKVEERKKSERELRREEVMRARQAEREERLREMRKKEEKTMEGLLEIARARFGGGAGAGAGERTSEQ